MRCWQPIKWLPWLKSQAGVSNRLPVKKNQRFRDFLTPAVPLACGGGGDRRRQTGLTAFQNFGRFLTCFTRYGYLGRSVDL